MTTGRRRPRPAQPPSDDAGLDRLTLEQKAARLFWVTVHGPAADVAQPANERAFGVGTPADVLRTHRPGGVVLFAWAGNTEHPAQVAALVRDLRAAADGAPLGIGIDEEGGRVTRLGPPATVFPSARAGPWRPQAPPTWPRAAGGWPQPSSLPSA